MKVPAITTQQMVEVDRLMVEKYGILLIQMMENAGRNLAELARRVLGGEVTGKRIAVVCGGGNNGGGGMVAARHLHNWGAEVFLGLVTRGKKVGSIPAHQLNSLESIGIHPNEHIALEDMDLVIDALIGYGLSGNPREPAAGWIERINTANRRVLALDSPSGLDTTTGIPGDPSVRATTTLTLALPKTGLLTKQAKPYIGDLYLADIGVPPELYIEASLGLSAGQIFSRGTIVKISEGERDS